MGITEMGSIKVGYPRQPPARQPRWGNYPVWNGVVRPAFTKKKKQLVLGMPGLSAPESRGPLRGLRAGMRTRAPWGVTI